MITKSSNECLDCFTHCIRSQWQRLNKDLRFLSLRGVKRRGSPVLLEFMKKYFSNLAHLAINVSLSYFRWLLVTVSMTSHSARCALDCRTPLTLRSQWHLLIKYVHLLSLRGTKWRSNPVFWVYWKKAWCLDCFASLAMTMTEKGSTVSVTARALPVAVQWFGFIE